MKKTRSQKSRDTVPLRNLGEKKVFALVYDEIRRFDGKNLNNKIIILKSFHITKINDIFCYNLQYIQLISERSYDKFKNIFISINKLLLYCIKLIYFIVFI